MDSNILEQYALRLGHDPKKLMDDYFDSSEEEQMELMSHIMQSGGEVGGSTQEANMQIVQLFAQKTGTPVEEIVAALQQMAPEQQSAAMQEMIGVIEGDEQEAVDNLQEEQQEMAQTGWDAKSLLGYSDKSPYRYNTSNLIKSNNITMNDTGIDLMGVSDTGDTQYMPAYSGNYNFDGSEVTEYPIYQTGPDKKSVVKVDKEYVYFTDGSKMIPERFKKFYTDKVETLNKNNYNSQERIDNNRIVSEYNAIINNNKIAYDKQRPTINPLTGKPDLAKGYWDRALNFTENVKDPRATLAEEKILPFYGKESDGFFDWAGDILPHLQKKGNQVLTGYYEYPSTTVSRYNKDLSKGQKFGIDLATDPAFLIDFGPNIVKNVGPKVAQAAKVTAELAQKYGGAAAQAIAKYGAKAAEYIGKYGMKGLEAAMEGVIQTAKAVEKYGPNLSKASTLKTQAVRAMSEEDDPYKMYFGEIEKEVNKQNNGKNNQNSGRILDNNSSNNYQVNSPANNLNIAQQVYNAPNKVAKNSGSSLDYNSIFKGKLQPGQKEIKLSNGQGYIITPDKNGNYFDESGKKWDKRTDGKFIPAKSSVGKNWTDSFQPFSMRNNPGVATSMVAKEVKYTGPKAKDPSTNGFNSYFANQDEINKPTDGRIDFGDVQPIERNIPQIQTRFNKNPNVTTPSSIPYSPKIEGITPEKPQAKSQYKFNTSSPLGDLINNFKVAKSFEAIDLPYMQEVDARMPEGIKYDPRPDLQSINEQFSAYKQGINPNSATGQAVLASLAGKQEAVTAQYLNGIQQQQATFDYQTQVNRAKLYNKIVAQRNVNAANYTDDVLRADANRDAIIDSTLSNIQQLQNNKQLKENAYNQMLAFNANVEDESGFFDRLMGRKKFSFNKDKAYAQNFGASAQA